jgi:hypothetical protein
MTAKLGESWVHFEILAIISLSGLLFIAAITEVGNPLWSIPAMTLFALTALTLICILPFASALSRPKDVTRPAT